MSETTTACSKMKGLVQLRDAEQAYERASKIGSKHTDRGEVTAAADAVILCVVAMKKWGEQLKKIIEGFGGKKMKPDKTECLLESFSLGSNKAKKFCLSSKSTTPSCATPLVQAGDDFYCLDTIKEVSSRNCLQERADFFGQIYPVVQISQELSRQERPTRSKI